MTGACVHLSAMRSVRPSAEGCEDCLRIGSWWLHLRMCLTCGHVGCCDESPNRHARRHFESSHHPLIRSLELGEDWIFCHADDLYLDLPPAAGRRVSS